MSSADLTAAIDNHIGLLKAQLNPQSSWLFDEVFLPALPGLWASFSQLQQELLPLAQPPTW